MAGPKRHPHDWAPRSFPSKPQKTKPHVLSAFLWTHLLFQLMGLGASGKDSTPTAVSGILGGLVIFPLNISVDTEFEHVAWSGPQGPLVLATAAKQIFIVAKSYQDRLNISWNSYSLCLSNLTLEDVGPYKAQINQKTSKFTTDKAFTLHVYEQVPEPQVMVKSVNMSDSGSCNVTLICFVERAWTSVLYSWTLRDTQASESHEGSTVILHWSLCDADLPYTCTARNPVSQNTSSPVHARKFCTAPGASRGDTVGETVMGILGESVTLPLTLSASHSGENVIWMFNTSIISKEQKAPPTADPFIKDPNRNSSQDYSLMIGQLKMENAGHYHAYVCSKASGVISMKHITLLVYGKLKKPKITWHPGLAEDGICRVSLTCSVEDGGHHVTYRWTPLPKGTFESQGGPHLNVSWTSGENQPNFTCIASNPVSNSSQQFTANNICAGPVRNTELYTGVSLMLCFGILCFGILTWYIWKRKRPCSDPASSYSYTETPADAPGSQKLDTLTKPAQQQHRPSFNSSSDSSETTEKDQERTDIPTAGRHQEYNVLTQEDTGSDSSSEGQAEYDLVTPESMVPASEDNTVYTQVFLNLQGKTPDCEQKESEITIYSCVQTPQKVVPPPQESDPESSEIPTYENLT